MHHFIDLAMKCRVSAGKENTILFNCTRANPARWLLKCYRADMAKEKKNQDSAPAAEGKAAVAAVAAPPAAPPAVPPGVPKISTKPAKIPKLAKKNKSRLPRKEKKAAQKAALAGK